MAKKSVKYERGVRECFIAPEYGVFLDTHGEMSFELALKGLHPEWCIVSVDYDACEMRTWAQCCLWLPEVGFSDLAEILNDPKRCPHVEMGSRLWNAEVLGVAVEALGHSGSWSLQDLGLELGCSLDEFLSWASNNQLNFTHERAVELVRKLCTVEQAYGLKKLDKINETDFYKDLRGLAKGPNFGLPGGMGALRLMDYCRQNYGVVLTIEQAERACQVWREVYREAQPYLDAIKGRIGRKYGSKGTIIEFASQAMRGQVGYCDGANGYFQALAAYIAKVAGWRLIEEAYERKSSPMYGARPLAFVHDEWLYAMRREQIHEGGFRMAEIMTSTAMEICTDLLFTAQPAAMYRWSKSAGDPCFGADKRLIPYEERAP